MGSKINPGRFDCYAAALPDEPQFILNARDPHMPETVRHWVMLRQAAIMRGEKPREDTDMLDEALRCAQEAVSWREENRLVTIQLDPVDGETFAPFVGPRWHYESNPSHGAIEQQFLNRAAILEQENANLKQAFSETSEAYMEMTHRMDTAEASLVTMEHRAVRAEQELAGYKTDVERLRRELAQQTSDTMEANEKLEIANHELDQWRAEGKARHGNNFFTAEHDMPDHRFHHLEKHGDYAWARGLNVSPTHLPKALHEMEHDFGWKLISIFGHIDQSQIGFIFRHVDKSDDERWAAAMDRWERHMDRAEMVTLTIDCDASPMLDATQRVMDSLSGFPGVHCSSDLSGRFTALPTGSDALDIAMFGEGGPPLDDGFAMVRGTLWNGNPPLRELFIQDARNLAQVGVEGGRLMIVAAITEAGYSGLSEMAEHPEDYWKIGDALDTVESMAIRAGLLKR